jgi:hypothetical protein
VTPHNRAQRDSKSAATFAQAASPVVGDAGTGPGDGVQGNAGKICREGSEAGKKKVGKEIKKYTAECKKK